MKRILCVAILMALGVTAGPKLTSSHSAAQPGDDLLRYLPDGTAVAVMDFQKITGSTLTRLEIEEAMVVEGAGHESWDYPSFTVEMETGTGKTYVYLRTIHELRRRFGWGKYVVVVPSVRTGPRPPPWKRSPYGGRVRHWRARR